MSRYFTTLLILLTFISFIEAKTPKRLVIAMNDSSQQVLALGEEKVSLDENEYILRALDASSRKDYANARKLYSELYNTTGKREYLSEYLALSLHLEKYDDVINKTAIWGKKNPSDIDMIRFSVNAYIGKKDFVRAKSEVAKIVAVSKKSDDFDMAGNIAVLSNDYDSAHRWFVMGYNLSPHDEIADKAATVMLQYQNKSAEAIAFMETHIRLQGCSKRACYRLAEMYASINDIDGMLGTYKRLYEKFKERDIARKVVQVYILKNNLKDLIVFLKKSKFDETILLEAYKSDKDYISASKLALKLYKQTKNSDFLAQSTIYTFEEATKHHKKPSQEILNDTVKNLKIVLETNNDDVYQNYLGYLLIDYNIDVKLGVEWVKKALSQNNDSPAYLDSLAWGYYKLGQCKEGFDIIKKVKTQLKNDKTVLEHYETLKKCFEKELKYKPLRDKIHDFR